MPKDIRPSQNVLRKAIFDIFGQDLEGVDFLELYAGSGAVGFEALSCGAKSVLFVEGEERCARVIESNIQVFDQRFKGKRLGRCEIMNTDAFLAIKQLAQMRK